MFTTIKGIYAAGKLILAEEPPVRTRAEVMVTFFTDGEEIKSRSRQKIILGLLEGKIDTPDEFNEPLEDLKA